MKLLKTLGVVGAVVAAGVAASEPASAGALADAVTAAATDVSDVKTDVSGSLFPMILGLTLLFGSLGVALKWISSRFRAA